MIGWVDSRLPILVKLVDVILTIKYKTMADEETQTPVEEAPIEETLAEEIEKLEEIVEA